MKYQSLKNITSVYSSHVTQEQRKARLPGCVYYFASLTLHFTHLKPVVLCPKEKKYQIHHRKVVSHVCTTLHDNMTS